ncbi:aromatic ring-hydroxylating dioxygenase subunit alpha [Sinirhodobacter populi]|uniref:Aromatic ring-hydroxylating dioxygenase subunit alpha n=1 Tax=Paenirhodobacter populi TaxID=2306993 RepID=A0A443K3E9_9RHOB|nr:aromatic ring-hydroxylating dioxygenase subunit alpha [Sinirhodobacter populi]RWR27299.1 aromatic ring-hydroxylating dioxygenase subunit alpha [Sinirhodobacter populi]
MSNQRIAELLNERRPGYSLPRDFYVSDDIFEADMKAIFETEWLFACSVAEIPKPGDYTTLQVGTNPIVVLRNRDGEIVAFHNTCRHRGSKICLHETGHANRLVCPYHQWVYELDGRLINARQMPADFDRAPFTLAPVPVEVNCGMVYICLADEPPSLDRFKAGVAPYIAPHMPDRTKVAFSSTIIEEANWKLVIENNRECYHCAGNHPELLVTLVEFALPDDPLAKRQFQGLMDRSVTRWEALNLPHRPADGGTEFRCIRLPFNDGCLSFTMDGELACRKLLADFTEPDLGSVRMFRVPGNWNHFLSDHIIHFRVLPLSAGRTAVKTTWLVHEDAVEGVDYDVQRLTEVWTATNDEDRILAENNHRGILSRAYRPGPYAPSEFMLNNFSDWYAGKMEDYIGGPRTRLAAE